MKKIEIINAWEVNRVWVVGSESDGSVWVMEPSPYSLIMTLQEKGEIELVESVITFIINHWGPKFRWPIGVQSTDKDPILKLEEKIKVGLAVGPYFKVDYDSEDRRVVYGTRDAAVWVYGRLMLLAGMNKDDLKPKRGTSRWIKGKF